MVYTFAFTTGRRRTQAVTRLCIFLTRKSSSVATCWLPIGPIRGFTWKRMALPPDGIDNVGKACSALMPTRI